MTSHELARKLLEGPDLPVVLRVDCDDDAVWGSRSHEVKLGNFTPERVVYNDENGLPLTNPTTVFVEAWSDDQFLTLDEDEEDIEDEEDRRQVC